MYLSVFSNVQAQILLIGQQGLAGHDGFGAQCIGYSSFHWGEVEHFDYIQYNVNHQELGDSLEWQLVSGCSTTFLYCPDLLLNFRDMLIYTSQVDLRAT